VVFTRGNRWVSMQAYASSDATEDARELVWRQAKAMDEQTKGALSR
jgi:hypothetical protein